MFQSSHPWPGDHRQERHQATSERQIAVALLLARLRRLSLARSADSIPSEAPSKPRIESPRSVAFEGVRERVGDVTIHDGLPGRVGAEVALMGPNSAGKTAALNVMTGVLPKRGFRVVINGLDVLRPDPSSPRAQKGGLVMALSRLP